MDNKFKSSFIPKQPFSDTSSSGTYYRVQRDRNAGGSLALTLSFLAFVFVIVAYGGLFIYERVARANIEEMVRSLEEKREQFEPARIAEYKRFDNKLKLVGTMLDNHVAMSELFAHLEDITYPRIQFISFEVAKNTSEVPALEEGRTSSTSTITMNLEGRAERFEDISFQASSFRSSEFILSSTFSGFSINEDQTIDFSVEAVISPQLVRYSSSLGASEPGMGGGEEANFIDIEEEVSFEDESFFESESDVEEEVVVPQDDEDEVSDDNLE